MKPTATTKQNRRHHPQNTPAILPARVSVKFLPHFGWQVDIGRTPAKAFVTPQTLRDNAAVAGYKPANGRSQPPRGFVPVRLMMDAKKQAAAPRQLVCRATPKTPVNH
jgi:hypothetical protein